MTCRSASSRATSWPSPARTAIRSVIGLAGQYATVDELLTGRENLELIGRHAVRHPAGSRRRHGPRADRPTPVDHGADVTQPGGAPFEFGGRGLRIAGRQGRLRW